MRQATISSLASARSQDRATSYRRYARDDTTNRNPYNCRCAPAVSSSHPFVHEIFFPAAARHRAVLVYSPKAGPEESRESFAMRVARDEEMNSATPRRILFGYEIPAIENDRTLPMRRDQ